MQYSSFICIILTFYYCYTYIHNISHLFIILILFIILHILCTTILSYSVYLFRNNHLASDNLKWSCSWRRLILPFSGATKYTEVFRIIGWPTPFDASKTQYPHLRLREHPRKGDTKDCTN